MAAVGAGLELSRLENRQGKWLCGQLSTALPWLRSVGWLLAAAAWALGTLLPGIGSEMVPGLRMAHPQASKGVGVTH